MAIIVYVPRLETVEVKTALEIAEEEYRRAADESAKWNKFCNVISDTCGEYNTELEAVNKEFRNLAGRYKRSTRNDTRSRLHYQMLVLRRQIEALEPVVDWLQRMYDKAAAQYRHEYENELAAKRNVVNARAAAGLKYSACVNTKCGDRQIPLRADVKTVADAVAFIYQNADRLASWFIYTERVEGLTTRRNTIAEGRELDSEIFVALIERYSDSTVVINAEIATPAEEIPPVNSGEEFQRIVIRAMHYFTLDDFLTPIAELRAFCKRNKSADAECELAEWIQMATDNGVEVPVEIDEVTAIDTATQVAELGVKIITSKPNKRGALICYVNGEKISYQRAVELYHYHFGDGKIIWCYGLSETETAERVNQALANNPFAVETFSLAPTDLPDAEEFTSDRIIRDTQFDICAITSWLPAIERHKKVITERKAERAALHYTASPRQNIRMRKAGIAVMTSAGYLQRAKDFADRLVQAEKRLDFL